MVDLWETESYIPLISIKNARQNIGGTNLRTNSSQSGLERRKINQRQRNKTSLQNQTINKGIKSL